MHILRTDSLEKTYPGKFNRAFKLGPIRVDLKPGEILGVMGPAGSGKTTLLKILWGFVKPDQGSVNVFGMTPHLHQVSVRLRAGYLSDSSLFYGWMNARRFLEFISAFYENWDDEYAEHLLQDFAIDSRQLIGYLSRADQTKLGIVAAAGHHPSLLLMDEPIAGLDPAARHEILLFVKDIAREQKVGIVITSKVSDDLDKGVGTVLMLDNGRVIEYESAAMLKTRYGSCGLEEVFAQSIAAISQARRGDHA